MSRSTVLCPIPTTRFAVRPGWLVLAAVIAVCGGCGRKYWREQADDLSYDIIAKKELDPRWTLPRFDVRPDPRSRFYDPFDPDFTPLPPDDPAAHQYMHWVYGMNGYKQWHKFGDLPAAENPDWLQPFGLSSDVVAANYAKPALLPQIENLTLEEAIELSWIHSRDYQTQIENVYLAALALTLQRFNFDLQFVGLTVGKPSAQVTMEDVPSTSDSVGLGSGTGLRPLGAAGTVPFGAGVSQLFPTGAQFIAEMANNTLWVFSGGAPSDATATTLSYSLVQPLLANSGRRFVMEGLTLTERNLLYALRDLARFRMGFFTSTVAGGTTAGLTSGVQGVAQPLATLTTPIAGGTGTAAGGYLGLLQQLQGIYNTEYNISQLKEQLDRIFVTANQRPPELGEDLAALPNDLIDPALRVDDPNARLDFRAGALPDKFIGRIRYSPGTRRLHLSGTITDDELRELLNLSADLEWRRAISDLADRSVEEIETTTRDVAQLQTQLANNCVNLRSARVNLQNTIDSFKLFLGLPPDMPISIDDSLLKPFQFIDPRLLRLQDRLKSFVPDPPPIPPNHPDAEVMARVNAILDRFDVQSPDLTTFRELVGEMERLLADTRRDGLDVLQDDFRRLEEQRKNPVPKPPADDCFDLTRNPEVDVRLNIQTQQKFERASGDLSTVKAALQAESLTDEERRKTLDDLIGVREDLLKITRSISVVQINVRVDLVNLNRFDLERDETVGIGLENRMDLMNVRAQLMDARRNVEVNANQLQAVLNVVAAGDIRTQPLGSGNNNPFDFRGNQSSFRAGVQFVTPVQLVAQRNAYRASLIAYQRARRNYMRIEDQVKFDLRTTWRLLDVQRRNFDTARAQVRAAAAQLDIQSELSTAPAIPGAGGGAGAANTGLNTLQALNSVLQAQNQMIQIWVNYESFRLDMYNFMGTMEIDEFGFWVDDFYRSRALAARAGNGPDALPPQPPPEPLPSPPQELKDEPVDAPANALPQQPTDANRTPKKHREKLQLVKSESWPERPASAPGSGAKASVGPAGAADGSGRRSVGVEVEPLERPGRTDRPDRRTR